MSGSTLTAEPSISVSCELSEDEAAYFVRFYSGRRVINCAILPAYRYTAPEAHAYGRSQVGTLGQDRFEVEKLAFSEARALMARVYGGRS